jgi:MerR family transcriptional regulator/heat shock protein HspR
MTDEFDDAPVLVISVVAQLTGLHAQTLRQYDRLGLVTPQRTSGGGRRYSLRDVERLRSIQTMSSAGVGLAGVERILEQQNQIDALQARLAEALEALQQARASARDSVAMARSSLANAVAIEVWRPPERQAPWI